MIGHNAPEVCIKIIPGSNFRKPRFLSKVFSINKAMIGPLSIFVFRDQIDVSVIAAILPL